jgi:hypothetical protein
VVTILLTRSAASAAGGKTTSRLVELPSSGDHLPKPSSEQLLTDLLAGGSSHSHSVSDGDDLLDILGGGEGGVTDGQTANIGLLGEDISCLSGVVAVAARPAAVQAAVASPLVSSPAADFLLNHEGRKREALDLLSGWSSRKFGQGHLLSKYCEASCFFHL